MPFYCESQTVYKRLKTREVKVGSLLLGNHHPIRVQTMTTTDTMDTLATVEQTIRCIEAGAELVRITAPSKKEAENLRNIKDELVKQICVTLTWNRNTMCESKRVTFRMQVTDFTPLSAAVKMKR